LGWAPAPYPAGARPIPEHVWKLSATTGFIWKEEQLVVCTAPSAPKAAALSERPNVAVTIDTGNTSATAKQLLIRWEDATVSAQARGRRPRPRVRLDRNEMRVLVERFVSCWKFDLRQLLIAQILELQHS
jgi:hypothetical protein